MTAELITLGISHKTATVQLRERLAFTQAAVTDFLHDVAAHPDVHEAVVISTCNRTELTLVVGDPVAAESAVLAMLAQRAQVRPTELAERMYSPRNCDAARQLFRVTAGLESMIVGEAEIQGQVKRAYELALVEGATGAVLNRLFRGALTTGKRVRSETMIGAGGISVPSAAVELATRTLGDLGERRVLLIGAGETAQLTAKALAAKGVNAVFVANRRYDRAIGLAQRFGGEAVRFDDLPGELERADIVVSSTNSPHHIVEREELELVAAARGRRPLLLIDLAVPRDIDPSCREVDGVVLRDVDDVQTIADRNATGRETESRRAEQIVGAELSRFEAWLGSLEVLPTVSSLRSRADEIVRRVLAENEARFESLTDADRARVEAMVRAVASRILHEPTLRLKRAGEEEDAYKHVAALRELFGLDAATEPEGPGAEVTPIRARREGERGN